MPTMKKKPAPRPDMRDMLFGDLPPDQWGAGETADSAAPWGDFARAREALSAGRDADAIAAWNRIAGTAGLEARHYLQAWHFLRSHGAQPPAKVARTILGVVVEVSLPEGLDIVAAYADRSARYFNYSGKAIIWEHPSTALDAQIDALLASAATVVAQIGPWTGPRPPAPKNDHARLNFLTPIGLHFGEAPMDALQRDPMGGPVLAGAARLMSAMIDLTTPAS